MALKRPAAHIAVLAFEKKGILALAAAGGCYVGAPPHCAVYEVCGPANLTVPE